MRINNVLLETKCTQTATSADGRSTHQKQQFIGFVFHQRPLTRIKPLPGISDHNAVNCEIMPVRTQRPTRRKFTPGTQRILTALSLEHSRYWWPYPWNTGDTNGLAYGTQQTLMALPLEHCKFWWPCPWNTANTDGLASATQQILMTLPLEHKKY